MLNITVLSVFYVINQTYQYGTESIEVMYMRINFSPPDITELEINEVIEALKKWVDYDRSSY